jgi:hypothetical protein
LASSGVPATFSCGYNVTCNGATNGSINLSVTGGCAPYAYLWSNGSTSEDPSTLGAGTYGVTVTDANGCTTTNSFTLTQPAILGQQRHSLRHTIAVTMSVPQVPPTAAST